jgi:hypothetical protein
MSWTVEHERPPASEMPRPIETTGGSPMAAGSHAGGRSWADDHPRRVHREGPSRGELFISQPYELYSGEPGDVAAPVRGASRPSGGASRTRTSCRGSISSRSTRSAFRASRRSTEFLAPLSAFESKAVSGYVPAFLFFDCLRSASSRRPSPSATARGSTTCPSRTSSTTSPATCRCTRTAGSRRAGALRRGRRGCRSRSRRSTTRPDRCAPSRASSRRWRASSGSPSSSG